jgi:PAS domain S-box-containing protein
MKKYLRRTFFATLLLYVLFLIALNSAALFYQRSAMLAQAVAGAQDELDAAGEGVRSFLLQQEYGRAAASLGRWAEAETALSRFRAVAPNGAELVTYTKIDLGSPETVLTYVVTSQGQPLLTLEAGYDFSYIHRRVLDLSLYIGIASIVATALVAAGVWFVLRKTLLDPLGEEIIRRRAAEESLTRIRDDLELIVSERTRQLREANDHLAAEIETGRRQAALIEEHRNRLVRIIDAMPVGILLIRASDHTIARANPAAAQLAGRTEAELVGRNCCSFICSDSDGCFLPAEGGEIRGVERSLRTPDGKTLTVLTNVVEIALDGEKHYMESFQDITDYKNMFEEKKKLQAQLLQAQKMEAVGTLASGIAHDFRNILQAIQGYAETIKIAEDAPLDVRAKTDKILSMSERGSSLIEHLLSFSRKHVLETSVVDVNAILDDSVDVLKRTLPKMVLIRSEKAPEPLFVRADANQLHHMLYNLALNGSDAMPDGGTLTLRAAAVARGEAPESVRGQSKADRFVVLEISDTGVGMDAKTMSHLFEPFFTTKGVGKGTGLGLFVAYGVVKEHGGVITCHSEPGRGTTFSIHLPAVASAAREAEPPPAPAEALRGTETILVADDEEAILEIVTDFLQMNGYTVLIAHTGEEALDIYRRERERIGLVILDLGMPGMGGRACISELLKIDPDVKIVVASGYVSESATASAKEMGARAYLVKPYRVASLLRTVRQALD